MWYMCIGCASSSLERISRREASHYISVAINAQWSLIAPQNKSHHRMLLVAITHNKLIRMYAFYAAKTNIKICNGIRNAQKVNCIWWRRANVDCASISHSEMCFGLADVHTYAVRTHKIFGTTSGLDPDWIGKWQLATEYELAIKNLNEWTLTFLILNGISLVLNDERVFWCKNPKMWSTFTKIRFSTSRRLCHAYFEPIHCDHNWSIWAKTSNIGWGDTESGGTTERMQLYFVHPTQFHYTFPNV